MPKDNWDDDEIPFQDNKPDVWHEYRCTRCKFVDKVPDFVVEEFAMDRDDLKPGEAPEVACPRCGRPMKMIKPNAQAT